MSDASVMFLPMECEGEELLLSSEKAVYWPREKMLWIADTHFGKSATFRAAGIPLPRGITATDLERMTRLIELCQARELLILGDFIHAKSGRAEATFALIEKWFKRFSHVKITLIRGNHDRHAGDPPKDWGINVVDQPLNRPPFAFYHEPPEADGSGHYTVAGHIHPSVHLRDTDGSRLRIPCFKFGKRAAIIPSFGTFTGSFSISPRMGDRVFAVARHEVWLVPIAMPSEITLKKEEH